MAPLYIEAVLLVVALALFFLALIEVPSRINLTVLAWMFLVAALLVSPINGIIAR